MSSKADLGKEEAPRLSPHGPADLFQRHDPQDAEQQLLQRATGLVQHARNVNNLIKLGFTEVEAEERSTQLDKSVATGRSLSDMDNKLFILMTSDNLGNPYG